MSRGWPRAALVLVGVGAALSALSLALLATRFGESASVEFGWFGYSGDSPAVFLLVTSRDLWAAAAGTLGVGLVAAGVGYAAGSRRVPVPAEAGVG